VLRQAALIASISIVFGSSIVILARRRALSLRYTVGWLAIAIVGLIAASLAAFVQPTARQLGITPTALFAMAMSVLLLVIAVQLSISVSGLQRQVRRLAEAHALLADKVEVPEAD
jgi:hypothetical protein